MSFKVPPPAWLVDLEKQWREDQQAWKELTGGAKATGEIGKKWRATHRLWRRARGYSWPKSTVHALKHLRAGCFNADACTLAGYETWCPVHQLFKIAYPTSPDDERVKAPPKQRGLRADAMKDLRAQLHEMRSMFVKIKQLADEIARVLETTPGADK